jgi:two-component sensor histidine kinase
MLAPKQVVEANIMSAQQDKWSDGHNAARQTYFQWIGRRTSVPSRLRQERTPTAAELKDALAREAALLREKDELVRTQETLAQEFEHRLINSLQLIVSLLTLQSRQTQSAEAAAQLMTAAERVGAFGRVHRRLHHLDHLETVELKHFIEQLCGDLSGMLFHGNAAHSIAVEGVNIEIPANLGIPLGFIVNELISNAAKHARGEITVRLETTPELGHCLSVSDDGPGLPDGFHPGGVKGLGLKIIQALVRQMNGRLQVGPGAGQHGACFKVFFPTTSSTIERVGSEEHRAQRADCPANPALTRMSG